MSLSAFDFLRLLFLCLAAPLTMLNTVVFGAQTKSKKSNFINMSCESRDLHFAHCFLFACMHKSRPTSIVSADASTAPHQSKASKTSFSDAKCEEDDLDVKELTLRRRR
jgi:hypothetical protein